MKLSATRVLAAAALVAALLTAAPLAADETAACESARYCTCELPHRSEEWTDDLYLMLQRQVLLDLDYRVGTAAACGEPRLPTTPGVEQPLTYHRQPAAGTVRCLELGREPTRDGRTRLAFYGVEVAADGAGSANPDLSTLKQRCQQVREAIDDTPLGAPRDRYLTYQLSYVEADRALTLLSALGYSVLRYGEKTDEAGFRSYRLEEMTNGLRRPVIVEMLDSEVTSLVKDTASLEASGTLSGGSPLVGVTSGIPEQRLLIVYDADEKESIEALTNLLSTKIDVPARQILFEALVIEVSSDRLRDLGFTFDAMKDGQSLSFDAETENPFVATFTRPSIKSVLNLTARLKAVIDEGEGTVISRPSVMVLDGRQARIKIADEIPYLQYVSDNNAASSESLLYSTDYLTAGIILNLRPRSNQDGSEITTQVETIISSAGPAGVTPQGLPIAPTVQSREVQTFVRVANDTPFIIGGLLAQDRQQQTTRVPWLSRIPLLGALFRNESRSHERREVMVMITPHVVEPDNRSFAYAIARDSDLFDAFENVLFRNIYRLRTADVFDLGFLWQGPKLRLLRQTVDECASKIVSTHSAAVPDVDRSLIVAYVREHFAAAGHEEDDAEDAAQPGGPVSRSEALQQQGAATSHRYLEQRPPAAEPPTDPVTTFLQVLEEGVPGEEILAARMLMHTLQDPRFDPYVEAVADVGLFLDSGGDDRLRLRPLSEVPRRAGDCDPGADPTCTLVLTIPPETAPTGSAPVEAEFFPPVATWEWLPIPDNRFIHQLRQRNAGSRRAILLNESFGQGDDGEGPDTWSRLRYALLMKRLLAVNERPDLLTLRGYHVGRELVIPTLEELADRRHVIDRLTADFFYRSYDYYRAFETSFQQSASELARFLSADPACRELMASGAE